MVFRDSNDFMNFVYSTSPAVYRYVYPASHIKWFPLQLQSNNQKALRIEYCADIPDFQLIGLMCLKLQLFTLKTNRWEGVHVFVGWGGGVSILMDDIIPHIRHYLILQSSQHDSHHTVSGIPLHPSSLFSSFLSSFSFFPSFPPPPHVGTAYFCRQCCLLLASLLLLRHAIGDCFLLVP